MGFDGNEEGPGWGHFERKQRGGECLSSRRLQNSRVLVFGGNVGEQK
jgi:hypothetical protein